MELKEVIATSNLADIALIKSLLDSEGIPYLAQGEHFHAARLSPGMEPVRFMVPEAALEQAKDLLRDVQFSYGAFADFLDRDGLQNETP